MSESFENQEENMSWTLTVLNGIEISTQVGGTDWDSVKCLMLPFLQDFILWIIRIIRSGID